ncbi:hypothetical protein MesoLj131c_47130 [Mesorhizobium sp. 131-3-5]|nr:hypothetical protein MesoLj131c_47130 [Mesorhizobium sp. 131-3-5]
MPFDQVDVVLTEDGKTVLLCGYAGDDLYMQNVHEAATELDADTVETVEADAWRKKAKADQWRKM